MTKSEKYGIHLANIYFGQNIKNISLVLSKEQKRAFDKRWKELTLERNKNKSNIINDTLRKLKIIE